MSLNVSPTADYRQHDTDDAPQEERFERWCSTALLRTQPHGCTDPFAGSVQRLSCSAGTFSEIRSSPLAVARTHARCAQDGCDDIHLMLVEQGETVGDDAQIVHPGSIRLTDFARPCSLRWESPLHALLLYIPRDSVAAALGTDPGFLHQRILARDGLAPMLATQLRSLAALAPAAAAATRVTALRATIELALTALAADFGRIARAPEGCDDGMFASVNRCIQQELGSPALNPAVIAARVGCSRAHLYRLFARHGLSVADYVREARLQRTMVELQALRDPRETIGALAYRCGFENPIYFARLFKQRFGCTPQDVRRGRNAGAAPLREPALA